MSEEEERALRAARTKRSLSLRTAAERAGISDALRAELGASQANLLTGFARSIPDMFGKAYRWVDEMKEIAAFTGYNRPENDIYAAIAQLYARLGRDFSGPQAEIEALRSFFNADR